MSGGDLPADPEALSAVVRMPIRDVEAALSYCLGRLIEQDGDRLYQKRVRAEVQSELEYRRDQSALGKKGGRPRRHIQEEGVPKGTLSENQSPPAPAPAPAPAPNAGIASDRAALEVE